MSKQDLFERAKARQVKKRVEATGRFRELLLRSDKPLPGDEDAVVELLAMLGVELGDLYQYQILVGRLRQCELLADNVENCQDESQRKYKALADATEWSKQARLKLEADIEAKVVPLERARVAASARLGDAINARSDASKLRDQWAAFVQGVSYEEYLDARRARMKAATAHVTHGPSVRRRPTAEDEERLLGSAQTEPAVAAKETEASE